MTHTFTNYGRTLAMAAFLAMPALSHAQANEPLRQALAHLNAKRVSLGLSEADLTSPAVTDQYTDASNGVTHLYLRQRVQGIEVYGAVADVHLDRSGRVRAAHSSFIPDAAARAAAPQPALSAEQAIAAAARALNMPAPQGLQLLQEGTPTSGLVYSDGNISLEKIPAKLMYFRLPNGALALTWSLSIYPKNAEHYWDVRMDASSGQLLDQTDFVVGEEASFAALAQRQTTVAASTPAPTSPTSRPTTPNSYNVFSLPTESPLFGSRQVVSNPAHPQASPFGWHDLNRVPGSYTTTRGNNVDAYQDRANTNIRGYMPDGGPTLSFDFPLNLTGTSSSNRDAAITNLFYWNNRIHDVMERHGFTEAAGNFQFLNYGGQGRGNDAVQAEAQDGGGMNNANFATPPDGTPGRMQMYLWQQPGTFPLRVTSAGPAAGGYAISEAGWGGSLEDLGTFADTIVATAPSTACTPITNTSIVRGNIALIRRNGCASFKAQALAAQQAGARMVIISDSVAANTAPIAMANDTRITTPITIPVLLVTRTNGDRLRNGLAGTTPTLAETSVSRRDGDFENGIITHEYGHGISNRLTGGPANASCLISREQMGEGWSDFFGLWMTTRPGDVGTTPRGIGNYAIFQPTTGGGIRPRPYTTDMGVNNQTYALIGTSAYTGSHSIGSVWATVLWDLNWALIGRHGYNSDLYASTGGNNIALKLVLDGCKLQPCNPGFIDGRNAILRADSINNGAANSDLIWQVFARRGMGASASQGSSNSLNDQTVAFNLPTVLSSKTRLTEASMAIFPNPAQDRVTVRLFASSQRPVEVELVNQLGQVVQRTTAAAALLQREGVELSTAQLPAGLYVVRLTGSAGTATQKLVIRH